MRASVLPRYLIGSRDAIREVASSRSAFVIGIIFAVSAGLAREYDGEDLLREPWHALRPLVASLVSGTTLFLLVHAAAVLGSRRADGKPPPFGQAYRAFMGLFWMTAPMAWLYAIPYERFMSPVDAIGVNLWTLAIVAAWRVVLITRVISVLYGVSWLIAFCLVMLFADAVVFVAANLAPTPIIDVMGGIRHSDRDALIASATFSMLLLSVLSAPLWILGGLISVFVIKPNWSAFETSGAAPAPSGLRVVSIVSLVVWLPVLTLTQPEQIHRRDAERLLRAGRVDEAFALMSSKDPGDYPPHWNPPPRLGYRESRPALTTVVLAMRASWPADWIADRYLDKIRRDLRRRLVTFGSGDWSDIVAYLGEYAHIYEVARDNVDRISFVLEFDRTLSDADREALQRLHRIGAADDPNALTDAEKSGVLVQAVAESDLDTVRRLVAWGVDVDAVSPGGGGYSPLCQAAIADDVEIVALLVDAGASLDLRSGDYELTPALWAAYHGSTVALAKLLDLGADPHAGTEAFGSLIYAATFRGHVETVRLLLERDLGISLRRGRGSDGATPLHMAYWDGNSQLIGLLLEAGADPEARTADGRLPREFRR